MLFQTMMLFLLTGFGAKENNESLDIMLSKMLDLYSANSLNLLNAGMVFGYAVIPTLLSWTPHINLQFQTILLAEKCISSSGLINDDESKISYLSVFEETAHTSANEAFAVIDSLQSMVFFPDKRKGELMDMLGCILDGEAITLDYSYRRSLYNWIVSDVFPATLNGHFPETILTFNGKYLFDDYRSQIINSISEGS